MSTPEIDLARSIGEALLAYADQKSRQAVGTSADAEALIQTVDLPTVRGHRQQEILELLLAAPDEGWKTSLIAQLANMEQPTAYLALQALQRQTIIELVPGSDPQKW